MVNGVPSPACSAKRSRVFKMKDRRSEPAPTQPSNSTRPELPTFHTFQPQPARLQQNSKVWFRRFNRLQRSRRFPTPVPSRRKGTLNGLPAPTCGTSHRCRCLRSLRHQEGRGLGSKAAEFITNFRSSIQKRMVSPLQFQISVSLLLCNSCLTRTLLASLAQGSMP